MTPKEKIITDIADTKSAIDDVDTPADMKASLEKALASMEAKLTAIEDEEKRAKAEEEKRKKQAEKKEKEKKERKRNPKMQIMVGEKNMDDATYDEVLAKYNERRNTVKGLAVKTKTKSAFTIVSSPPNLPPPDENLESK